MMLAPRPALSAQASPGRRGVALLALFLLSAAAVRVALAETAPSQTSREVLLFEQGLFAAAASGFSARLQAKPKDVEALTYLGRIAFEENRIAEAVHFLEKAADAAPQDSRVHHWLGRSYGVQARELGAPRGLGPARRTRRALEKAVHLNPDNLEARIDLANFYRQAPMLVGGSTRAALAQLEEIERRSPYRAALIRGDIALNEQNWAAAERHYRAALGRDPTHPDPHFRLGMLFQEARSYEDAFEAFAKVLELDPQEHRAYFQIGKTADLSGRRLAEGEAALRKYLRCRPFFIMPPLALAHRHLGNIYLRQGRPDAARQAYQAAVKLSPADHEAATALKKLAASHSRRVDPD